jgi:transcriptional regulator with XRE-family HTH domain
MTLPLPKTTRRSDDQDERTFLRNLGRNVRVQRVTRDMSQDQLAKRARMSRNFVSSIERGTHGIDILRIRRLALVLDVDLDALVPPIRPANDSNQQPVRRPA